jgi:uncharacterized surface protein with fasciclin (FAS1) repeats
MRASGDQETFMIMLTRGALAATLALASAACMHDDMGPEMRAASQSAQASAMSTAAMSASGQRAAATAMANSPDLAAPRTVMVGGAAMYADRTIVENAMNSADHTTLVAAVKAAGLVETLSGPGPFTVFAPTNAAFAKLPPGAVDGLLKPEMKPQLQKALTYHVVAERLDAAELTRRIRAGGGTTNLSTVSGGVLSLKMSGSTILVTDAKGGMSNVTIGDVMQSNGVIHVVDAVLMAS